MRVLTFNTQATAAIHGRTGAKLRMDVKDGTLMIRPTDRKAGPHVLVEVEGKGKQVHVSLTEKQLEKLGGNSIVADAAEFGLVTDRYGWFALRAGDDLGEKAVADAKVSVTDKSEPKTEDQTPAE